MSTEGSRQVQQGAAGMWEAGVGNKGSRSKKYEAAQLGGPSQHPPQGWGSVAGPRRKKMVCPAWAVISSIGSRDWGENNNNVGSSHCLLSTSCVPCTVLNTLHELAHWNL